MEQKIRQDISIGPGLKNLRIENHFSQEKLCAELQRRGCDIGRSTYAKYEAGELNVKVSVLLKLTKVYHCTFNSFFAELKDDSEE